MLEVEDFIDSKINHLYVDDNGTEMWYNAYVADVDSEPITEDPENPDYFVYYTDNLDEVDADNIGNEDYFLCNLMADYVEGGVRFL